jgi:hypothetical protein
MVLRWQRRGRVGSCSVNIECLRAKALGHFLSRLFRAFLFGAFRSLKKLIRSLKSTSQKPFAITKKCLYFCLLAFNISLKLAVELPVDFLEE